MLSFAGWGVLVEFFVVVSYINNFLLDSEFLMTKLLIILFTMLDIRCFSCLLQYSVFFVSVF